MTKIKICGITNLEDAELSAKFGADALGFNFYEKSPRYILPEKAREIVEQIPAEILKVGVFVNESLDNIVEIAEIAKLDALQLHGEETPEFAKELKLKTNLEIIKAFRVSPTFTPEDVLKYEVDAILLDAYNPKEHGGTGETFDWEIARKVKKVFPKMYLAGGLSQDNIANAISNVKPFAVDACSCLEMDKGLKDKVKIINFICNCHYTNKEGLETDYLLDTLREMRANVKAFFPRKSISQISSFLYGYYSYDLFNSDLNSKDNFLRQFDKWLKIERSSYTGSVFLYSRYFLEKCNGDEEKAFDLFFALLEEFKLEREISSKD